MRAAVHLLAAIATAHIQFLCTAPPSTPTGTVRSSKTDGITINVTRDKTRDKCIELIYDSLCTDSTARKFCNGCPRMILCVR